MKNQERAFLGVWIPKEIWESKTLSAIEKMLLTEIQSLDNERGCFANNNHFASFLDCSVPTITRGIKKLQDLKFIRIEVGKGNSRIIRVADKAVWCTILYANQNDYTSNQNDYTSNQNDYTSNQNDYTSNQNDLHRNTSINTLDNNTTTAAEKNFENEDANVENHHSGAARTGDEVVELVRAHFTAHWSCFDQQVSLSGFKNGIHGNLKKEVVAMILHHHSQNEDFRKDPLKNIDSKLRNWLERCVKNTSNNYNPTRASKAPTEPIKAPSLATMNKMFSNERRV